MVDSVRDVPYLEVVASRSQDGRTLFVMGINKSLDSPAKVSIQVEGFRPRNGRAWSVSGPAIDANTGTGLPAGVSWGKQARMRSFDDGAPDQVRITESQVSGVGARFEYTFPPHTVTSLELQ
jgi:alpha-L-arabinofuranosidase